jgi:hypothetical protein
VTPKEHKICEDALIDARVPHGLRETEYDCLRGSADHARQVLKLGRDPHLFNLGHLIHELESYRATFTGGSPRYAAITACLATLEGIRQRLIEELTN